MIKIFNHYFHKRTLLKIGFDLSLVLVTIVITIFFQVSDPATASTGVLSTSLLLALGIIFINAALGFYQRVQSCTLGQTRARAVLSLCLSLPLAYVVLGLSPLKFVNETVLVLTLLATLVVMLLHRTYVVHASPQPLMRQRVLVYGSGPQAKLVGRALQQSDPNVNLVGYYASPNESFEEVSTIGLFSSGRSLTDIVQQERVDEIVVALSERRGGSMPLRELLDCKLNGVRVVDMATHFEKTMGQIRRDTVSAGWLIFGDGFDQGLLRSSVKRLFDIVCACILIFITWPIMLITAIFIKMESPGSVFYLQERVGLNSRSFNVVKFRSMCANAEKDGQPRWAAAGDTRVTRVGRTIRKLRIDELPQLFSVLKGDMSLVGPRPERPFFVDQLTRELPYYAVRHSVKPGVTGWAQVRYHYGSSVEDAAEKLQYDLYYVKNHTLFLDIVVMFETVGVVLLGKGAQ